jgi:UPF0755 protein
MKKALTVFILITLIFLFFVTKIYGDFYVAKDPSSEETIKFSVEKGEGFSTIAQNLYKQGLIKSALSFKIYVILNKSSARLKAGQYELSQKMTIIQIAQKIILGEVLKKNLIIMEGWDLEDIGKYLEKEGICSSQEFLKAVNYLDLQELSYRFSFLSDKPEISGIEGYVFPDTYAVTPDSTSINEFLEKAFSNFDTKFSNDLRQEIEKQEKSVFEILTMASLIEKEVKTLEDKKIVSGILWKRMEIGMPLQVDATIAYITGRNSTSISISETKIDSPYNTYRYRGLPVGPICNPGLDSIIAAIYPQKNSYLYYLSAPGGKTIFSKTFTEHQAAKQKYLK